MSSNLLIITPSLSPHSTFVVHPVLAMWGRTARITRPSLAAVTRPDGVGLRPPAARHCRASYMYGCRAPIRRSPCLSVQSYGVWP